MQTKTDTSKIRGVSRDNTSIGMLAPFGSAEWQSRVYYPGVRTREEAKVIELGEGDRRTDIDFKLPSSTAP